MSSRKGTMGLFKEGSSSDYYDTFYDALEEEIIRTEDLYTTVMRKQNVNRLEDCIQSSLSCNKYCGIECAVRPLPSTPRTLLSWTPHGNEVELCTSWMTYHQFLRETSLPKIGWQHRATEMSPSLHCHSVCTSNKKTQRDTGTPFVLFDGEILEDRSGSHSSFNDKASETSSQFFECNPNMLKPEKQKPGIIKRLRKLMNMFSKHLKTNPMPKKLKNVEVQQLRE